MEVFALSVEMSNKSQSVINYPFQNKNIKSDKILLPNTVSVTGKDQLAA